MIRLNLQNLISHLRGGKTCPMRAALSSFLEYFSHLFQASSTQVLAALSDAQPGAVKNNNTSKTLTAAQTTENGTCLRVEKHFRISRSALEFIECNDPWLLLGIRGQEVNKKEEKHGGTSFLIYLALLQLNYRVLLKYSTLDFIPALLHCSCIKRMSCFSNKKCRQTNTTTLFIVCD